MDSLFEKNENEYGSEYRNHFFEQYKIYLESAEKNSDRRHSANNHFITINAALVSVLGAIYNIKFFENDFLFKISIAFLGILICFIFGYLIRSYKQLNSGKFEIIHKIEANLPIAMHKYEWDFLGEGKNYKKYYPFSHIEILIPWVFGCIYFILGCCYLLHFIFN